MVDFGKEMQTMDDGLTRRDGCVRWQSHIAYTYWVAEKWQLQGISDVDGAMTRLELWGESLGLTELVIPDNDDLFTLLSY